MKIIYIHKDKLAKRPPVISALLILNELGYNVTLIDEEISDFWKTELDKHHITYLETGTALSGGRMAKFLSYYRFRKTVFKFLHELETNRMNTMVWVEGAQTIVALGRRLNIFRHILQIQELHNKSKRQMKAIGSVIHQAEAVFMPEYCRTLIYKVWFNLKRTPIELPNKPYVLLEDAACYRVLKGYEYKLNGLKGKKIILYQGGVKRIRMLDRIAKAINLMQANYHLLVVGTEQEDGVINELRQITDEITHVGFIPSPDYLAFCKIAYIGFVCYQPNSLNNIFCAPNKIFEYSAYGLPMIANDIPGLKFTVEANKAGVTIDPDNVDSIVRGIKQIEAGYDGYRAGAKRLYASVDNKRTIQGVLEQIEKR